MVQTSNEDFPLPDITLSLEPLLTLDNTISDIDANEFTSEELRLNNIKIQEYQNNDFSQYNFLYSYFKNRSGSDIYLHPLEQNIEIEST